MARAYSQDLRERVLSATATGTSARQAAERFGVGVSTAIVWVRRARLNGERTARRQGQPRRSKLDAHAAFLRELVARTCDITLSEMQARLREERGVSAGIGTLSRFFGRQDYSWKKKPRTPPSRTGRTSWPRVRPGSTPSPTSIRRAWSSSTRPAPPPRWLARAAGRRGANGCGPARPMDIGKRRPSSAACGSAA